MREEPGEEGCLSLRMPVVAGMQECASMVWAVQLVPLVYTGPTAYDAISVARTSTSRRKHVSFAHGVQPADT
jgi:hypothetical protein